jgi:crotonobetaine/carnitine-CoA ligase
MFEQRLGVRLVETYGLSEAPMAALNTRQGALKSAIGSAGRGSALFAVAVVDEHDNLLPPGEIGEIVMRPRRPDAMMIGYHGKPEATIEAFRNLWFHSGDRGRMTEQGELHFEDRLKDSIRRRGENISAWEIESVLEKHPDIAEVAIYGVGSADADEDVAAAIVAKRPDIDLARLLAFARERLPQYAVPSLLILLPELPKTSTAKVQKAKLRTLDLSDYLKTSDL